MTKEAVAPRPASAASTAVAERCRVVIENVTPEVDAGRHPIKRVVGESVVVEADLVADGHDVLAGVVAYRPADDSAWREVPLQPLVNDRWQARFTVDRLGEWVYTIHAWVDGFLTWRHGLEKKVEAKQDVGVDLMIGVELIRAAARRATGRDQAALDGIINILATDRLPQPARTRAALDVKPAELMTRYPDRSRASAYMRQLKIRVDRPRAAFGAWYEMFPRSTAERPGRHGTFADAAARLPYVADMGFDIVYLPPIHPIGLAHRKGKNNNVTCKSTDPGSPWAIGSAEGGHKAIHPKLGTFADFRKFVAAAKKLDLEVALDIAFQCSPDHPYVSEHPEWFRKRPDGTIQYAENPPKKYQDIYPFDFETDAWQSLWHELKSVFEFWLQEGVKIFRVDNPHTKSLAFWEWVIAELRTKDPEVILLAEAFTRPKLMYALAKRGYCQSYTYFTWRNSKWELTEYLKELTQGPVREFFRPNFWPNTPDILHAALVHGGRPAFASRFVLASTLGASYGIYGPAFELGVNMPREPGSEEYVDSEKYEVKCWRLDVATSLKPLIRLVNRARHEHEALQSNGSLHFHDADNDQIICYSKRQGDDVLLMVVNLDPAAKQRGFVNLSLSELGLAHDQLFEVHDLLTDARYAWRGARNYVELDPQTAPAHLFVVTR
jgi:starch synthase (maltosyl-transferring)